MSYIQTLNGALSKWSIPELIIYYHHRAPRVLMLRNFKRRNCVIHRDIFDPKG